MPPIFSSTSKLMITNKQTNNPKNGNSYLFSHLQIVWFLHQNLLSSIFQFLILDFFTSTENKAKPAANRLNPAVVRRVSFGRHAGARRRSPT